ncbi:hypothetical protein [Clostridium sp. DL1XJH146]
MEDKIVMHNVFNLSGNEYSYADVSEIYTGTVDESFYYRIELKDGNIIDFTGGTSGTNDAEGDRVIYNMDHNRSDNLNLQDMKKGKQDRIKLIIHIKNSKEIEVLDSKMAYKMKEVLDEIENEKYIKEKMKQYGMQLSDKN